MTKLQWAKAVTAALFNFIWNSFCDFLDVVLEHAEDPKAVEEVLVWRGHRHARPKAFLASFVVRHRRRRKLLVAKVMGFIVMTILVIGLILWGLISLIGGEHLLGAIGLIALFFVFRLNRRVPRGNWRS